MFFYGNIGPLLMNDIGENGKLFVFCDVVVFPVVGELIAGFLPHHALLYPFLAASVLLLAIALSVQP